MYKSTLYIRVVPQDRDRDYVLLASFDPAVVQRTAAEYSTLTSPTRASLDAAVARLQQRYSADIKDVTAPAIAKQLARIFGELPPPGSKKKSTPEPQPTEDAPF
jgi:hypothetical protein